MSIQGIGYNNQLSYFPAASTGAGTGSSASAGIGAADSAADAAVQNFENYMKESPAERMVDQWLKDHGLTRESLAKLPPDKQAAIMKEMAKDIADEIKQKAAEKKKGVTTDISA